MALFVHEGLVNHRYNFGEFWCMWRYCWMLELFMKIRLLCFLLVQLKVSVIVGSISVIFMIKSLSEQIAPYQMENYLNVQMKIDSKYYKNSQKQNTPKNPKYKAQLLKQ